MFKALRSSFNRDRSADDEGISRKARALAGFASFALVAVAIIMAWIADPSALTSIGFLILMPMAIGAGIATVSLKDDEMPWMGCLVPPALVIGLSLVGWLLLNETAVCLAMIGGIWFLGGLGGVFVSLWFRYAMRRFGGKRHETLAIAWLTLPIAFLLMHPAPSDDWRTVSRSIVVDAPRDAVWKHLLTISNVGNAERKWNFTQDIIGIPRPVDASLETIDGKLIRKAEWGQGIRFEEEITRIVPHRELQWRFRFPDRSISLRTDRHIHPDSATLKIHSGGYKLEELAYGKTRLTLWTRYRQRVGLPAYTAWWGQRFLGDIQENILTIIDKRAGA